MSRGLPAHLKEQLCFNEVRLDETPQGRDDWENVHIPGSAQQSGVLMRWSEASETAL